MNTNPRCPAWVIAAGLVAPALAGFPLLAEPSSERPIAVALAIEKSVDHEPALPDASPAKTLRLSVQNLTETPAVAWTLTRITVLGSGHQGVGVDYVDQGGSTSDRWIEPGETKTWELGFPIFASPSPYDAFDAEISAVVFDDLSYAGKPEAVEEIFSRRRSSAADVVRAKKVLETVFAKASDAPSALAHLDESILGLGEGEALARHQQLLQVRDALAQESGDATEIVERWLSIYNEQLTEAVGLLRESDRTKLRSEVGSW